MPAPLDDITIYYWGQKIKDAPEDVDFRKTVNYVCDFYHRMLFGYKPPKTGRICIHLHSYKAWDKPDYNGSICRIANIIDDDKFLSLSKEEKYQYILDIVHSSCIEAATVFNWNKEILHNAYDEVRSRKFFFSYDYPIKKSKDKKKAAFVQVVKTEDASTLYLNFLLGDANKKVKLFEKTNWFWYDPIYDLAKNSKWLDLNTFGVHSKKHGKHSYYSLVDDVIIGNVKENSVENLL